MNTDKQLTAVQELRDCDHCFLTSDGVARFADLFGVTLTPTRHWANPGHPKGLTLNDGAKSAIGMAADDLACAVCDQLKVTYVEKYGRGSQLRECCDQLELYFNKVKSAATVLAKVEKEADRAAGKTPSVTTTTGKPPHRA